MSILIALVIFSCLILFHEWGHYLAARRCGVTVTEFSLGMGPRLFSFRRGETRYSWKLLPLGGSCMMLGELDDEEGEGNFQGKPVWQRALIIAMGPLFNFLMAQILAMILVGMAGYDPPGVLSVTEGMPAALAGIEEGDRITSINGRKVYLYSEISDFVFFHQDIMANKDIPVTWTHEGEKKSALIRAALSEDGRYIFGIRGSSGVREKTGPLGTVFYGGVQVRYWIHLVFESLGMLFRGQASVGDLSGPVGIVSTISETYNETKTDGIFYVVINMINIAVLLSANLGVVNLLPIPALDGGRLLLLLAEAVRGKKMDPEKEAYIHFAGFALLMILMVIVMYNDIHRLM